MVSMIRGNLFKCFLLAACLVAPNFLRAAQPVDLRIVIDISGEVRGSMPANEHLDAVAMLLDRLPGDSRAGVWTFGKYTNHLITYGTADAQWHELADEKLPAIRSVASWRDISRALTQATFDRARGGGDYRRIVLLLSAGGVYISDDPQVNNAAQQQLLAEQVGPLREAGIEVHTVALDGGQGKAFMSALAKESNGLFFAVTRPGQIHTAIARFADSLSPDIAVPFADGEFAIDNAVDRFSALLAGDPDRLVLESPSGKLVKAGSTEQGISRVDGPSHALVEVENPEMGRWRVQGNASQASRVFVESGLDIALQRPANHYVSGENIPVAVIIPTSGEQSAAYAAPVAVTLEARGFEGGETFAQQLQAVAGSPGHYSVEIPGLVWADNYQLTTTVKALDYSRVVNHTLQVRDLLDLDVQAGVVGGGMLYTMTAHAADSELDPGKSSLSVKVTDTAGETSVATLTAVQGAWRFELPDDGVSSEYRLELELEGETISGRRISYQPRPLVITLPERTAATGVAPASGEQPGPGADSPGAGIQVSGDADPMPLALSGDRGRSTLLVALAVICVVVGIGLAGLYFWLRARAPYRVDLASDAAAYRSANNISIRRIQEPGRPFQEVRDAGLETAADAQIDSIELDDAGVEVAGQEVFAEGQYGAVPLVEDIVPEEVLALDTAAYESAADDVLPEDAGVEPAVAGDIAPEELVPEDLVSEAMMKETAPTTIERADIAGVASESLAPLDAAAEVVDGAFEQPLEEPLVEGEAVVEEPVEEEAVVEESIEDEAVVEEAVEKEPVAEEAVEEEAAVEEPAEEASGQMAEDSAPEQEVISITRLASEELPDFETVDDVLEEEIAADTALVEETELATEWDNVAVLATRPGKAEVVDPVAEELGGEDPFEDYRIEYEASHGKERR